ncbi:MAG: SDR family oxidoreductase [Mesorhizobium sp.]|nr:SDR family oxidoreductase [Mesorhizobium sp.]
MPMHWAGKATVITGAARGQGAAEARLLLTRGATVYAVDVIPTEDPVWDELKGIAGGKLIASTMDVGDAAGWDDLAKTIATSGETLTGLVNNAGISFRYGVTKTGLDDWDAVLRTNLTGAFLGIRALAPLMPAGSSIVNIGSVAGHTGYFAAAYCASKWGLRGLTRAAALELGAAGIRVNCVSPGLVETPMTVDGSAFVSTMRDYVPLARAGTPDDIANTVLFLLEPEASYLNGADIIIDGGMAGAGMFAQAAAKLKAVAATSGTPAT